ncbi:MAG TPA: hypothetical protein VGJ54_10935, partial [Streptosporangiaceae bacterium]
MAVIKDRPAQPIEPSPKAFIEGTAFRYLHTVSMAPARLRHVPRLERQVVLASWGLPGVAHLSGVGS